MDIRIKGKQDGIETARALRREHDIPVIFLSAHADEATIERAGWLERQWTRLAGRSYLQELFDVSFSPGRAA